jgi:hypothetical protein
MIEVSPIIWEAIGRAVGHYQTFDYAYVEVPWAVPPEDIGATFVPTGSDPAIPGMGFLVGSAEQGFVKLDREGALGAGRFVACSPCFRVREPVFDIFHQPYFMKVELYRNDRVDEAALMEMIRDARQLFRLFLGSDPELVATDEGFDIEVNGIEVGSYGIRSYGALRWIYGTGLAEPRFSLAARSRLTQP